MFLTEHGYIVEKIHAVESTKDLKHQYVEFVFRKPAPKDEFGETAFADDVFAVRAWNKKMELVANLVPGDKVKAQLSLSGSEQFDREQSKFYYPMNLNIAKLTKI